MLQGSVKLFAGNVLCRMMFCGMPVGELLEMANPQEATVGPSHKRYGIGIGGEEASGI